VVFVFIFVKKECFFPAFSMLAAYTPRRRFSSFQIRFSSFGNNPHHTRKAKYNTLIR
jgi:hypothetical protein